MESFEGKLAVVTGGGTGMGRELVVQLAAEGCHVAACDINLDNLAETARRAEKEAPAGTRITTHRVRRRRRGRSAAVPRRGARRARAPTTSTCCSTTPAWAAAAASSRPTATEWDRTFGICWGGVYNCSRAFVPLLVASDDGYLVNTSSVNGFWAIARPRHPAHRLQRRPSSR